MRTFYAKNRKEWRKWLEKYHATRDEIWLIRYKKITGISCVSYDESVEEALCFGWIDSTHRSRDEVSSAQRFSPRRPKSNWSPSNRLRAKRLIAQGYMTPAGRETLPPDF